MVVIVVVNLVIVLRAEVQPGQRIPVRADDVLLVEAVPVGVAEQIDGASHHLGLVLRLVAIGLRPFAAGVKRPVAKAGIARFQTLGHFEEPSIGGVEQR